MRETLRICLVTVWLCAGCGAGAAVSGRDGGGGDGGGPGSWVVVPSPTGDELDALAGTGPDDVWAAGPSSLWHFDGARWLAVALPPGPTPYPAVTLWTGAVDDLWFAGAQLKCCAWRRLHGTWSSYLLNDNREVFHLWGSGPSDVWGTDAGDGVRPGYTGHWDGTSWTHLDSGGQGALWGSGADDLWAAGTGLMHRAGPTASWTPGPTLAAPMLAIAGSAQGDVWAVGQGAVHFDGASWSSPVSLPSAATLRGVWAASRSEVWAVGDGGVILHGDGTGWAAAASPVTLRLRAVWGSRPGDVWAVGDQGVMLHLAP